VNRAAQDPTSAAFFDALYADDADPWQFATDPDEQARYDDLVRFVDGRRHRRVLEAGCSIGAFTEVVAFDISHHAVAQARRRCAGHPGVEVRRATLPQDLPPGAFDLIVFSEVGYYFDRPTLRSLVDALVARLEPGGMLVGTHWLGTSEDHVLPGAEVHAAIDRAAGLQAVERTVRPTYEIGCWIRS
jgi:SAM-dependent methyltransferase